MTTPPSLARSSALNFVDGAISLVAALAVSVLLARMLGPDRFGQYALVMVIVTFTYLFARLGIPDTVRRYAAELDGRGERPIAAIVAGRALRIGLITSVGAAVLLALAGRPLSLLFHRPALAGYLLLGAAMIVPMMVVGVLRGLLGGLQLYRFLMRVNLATSPIWVAGCLVAVWNGGGITAVLLVGIGVDLLTVSALAWRATREVGIRWLDRLPEDLGRRLVSYNRALAVLILLNAIVWQRSELLFLGRFSGTDQVSFYAVPFALTERVADLIPGAILGVLLPGLTYAQAVDPARFSVLFSQSLRYLAMLTLPICLFGVPLAPVVIQVLYGPEFGPAAIVLQILLVSIVFGILGQASRSALLGIESQGWLLKTGGFAAAASIALDLALIPRFGAVGAAIANTTVQAAWALAIFAPLWRRLLWSSRIVIVKVAAIATVLAAMLSGVAVLRPTQALLIGTGIALLALYALVLQRLRLIRGLVEVPSS